MAIASEFKPRLLNLLLNILNQLFKHDIGTCRFIPRKGNVATNILGHDVLMDGIELD